MRKFKLKLVDLNPDVYEQFNIQFSGFENVEVYHGYFEDVDDYDCMVSPANSFGMMDGGIDAAIINYFGKQLELDVQKYILTRYSGEQPVGTSFIMPTENKLHPFLAHTPTMRIPQDINGTLNVYYAMKAMLETVEEFNRTNEQKIQRILCPGMGTFIGRMNPSDAIQQMALAYKHFLNPPEEMNVPIISNRLAELFQLLKK